MIKKQGVASRLAEEAFMEVFPYGESWMLLASEILYELDARGIVYRHFKLPPEITELHLNNTLHILTQPLEP